MRPENKKKTFKVCLPDSVGAARGGEGGGVGEGGVEGREGVAPGGQGQAGGGGGLQAEGRGRGGPRWVAVFPAAAALLPRVLQ